MALLVEIEGTDLPGRRFCPNPQFEPAILHDASLPGKRLVGRLGLNDAKGGPRCASVRPPDIVWSVDNH